MRRRILSSRPSPAMLVAVAALLAALGGSAIAGTGALTGKKVKRIAARQATKAVNAKFPVDASEIADGAVGSAKLADGAVTAQKTTMRWALVDTDGAIVDQSGGISVAAIQGSNYYLDFGTGMAGKAIQATTVTRDDESGSGDTALVGLCGGPPLGNACPEPGTNDQNHVLVFTSDAAGGDDPQAFYVTAF